jgi:hypothetical protein
VFAKEVVVGLFGFNPEKKLAKANEQLERGFFYEARLAYEEILGKDGIPDSIRVQAKEGWRKARMMLIAGQTEEARRLLSANDAEGAAESCRAAIEIAADDLDPGDAVRILVEIEGPPQTKKSALLQGLDEVAREGALEPIRDLEDAEPEEVVAGSEADELFEVYLNAMLETTAGRYRALGPAFRDAYLRLQDGAADAALQLFDRIPDSIRHDSICQIEKAQALLLAARNREALETLDGIEPPTELQRRCSEMRIILYDRLAMQDEAEREARQLWTAEPAEAETALLYAEILNARGKHDAALEVLAPVLKGRHSHPEADNLAAQAYRGLGRVDEARSILEGTVERYFQGGYATGDMQRFPVWAGRELLDLYVMTREDADKVRSLVQHLIRNDPANAEMYKNALASYAERMPD